MIMCVCMYRLNTSGNIESSYARLTVTIQKETLTKAIFQSLAFQSTLLGETFLPKLEPFRHLICNSICHRTQELGGFLWCVFSSPYRMFVFGIGIKSFRIVIQCRYQSLNFHVKIRVFLVMLEKCRFDLRRNCRDGGGFEGHRIMWFRNRIAVFVRTQNLSYCIRHCELCGNWTIIRLLCKDERYFGGR